MGSLKEYSGLTAKVKAMRSKLISDDEYSRIIEFDTVPQVAEYLRTRDGYEKVLKNADISDIHRETVEYAIKYSVYNDFVKLYKFSGLKQRKYLKLYFTAYEVRLIKKVMRKNISGYITREQNMYLTDIYRKYSNVPREELFKAADIPEVIKCLEGTIYYEPLKQVMDAGKTELFDYELALDMFYFKYMWKKRRNSFEGNELKSMSDVIGSEADLLNLMWIYRAKKFYGMTHSETAALVIPVYHRIKKPQMLKLLEANDISELIEEIGKTPYGRFLTPDIFEKRELDRVSKEVIDRTYRKYSRLEPYSLAVLSSYMRDKKKEMDALITIVECIRYGYPKADIRKKLLMI